MIILALDSTALSVSVALVEEERVLGEYFLQNGNTHSETLLPLIENLLGQFDFNVKNVDLFACNAGPGSFTGIRIGAATLKGLAFSENKPCVGVSTLASLARNLEGFPENALLSPVMNARRMQVYNALFQIRDGKPVRLTEDRAVSVKDLEAELKAFHAPVYLTGDGYEITKEGFENLKVAYTPLRLRSQSAVSTALCAAELYRSGTYTDDRGLVPVYLRPCQAERDRLAREGKA